jgi:multiple sugar transport system ATP-binding protein
MTVYKNMAFGLKLRRYPKAEIRKRVEDAAEILGITELMDRKPKALSGGQRQRVAVGRAIVRKPKAFLFDEPLSNLDAKMRVQMRTEISKLHTRLASTMIYVTHDQVEAMTMGDRIVVMKDGLIQQVADPLNLYENPSNMFVAGFIGSPPMNFFKGKIERDGHGLWFREPFFRVRVDEAASRHLEPFVDKEIHLGIRPEQISDRLYVNQPNPDWIVPATVEVVEPMGSEVYLYLNTGAAPFVARVDTRVQAEVNQRVEMVFDMRKAHFFDPATEAAVV